MAERPGGLWRDADFIRFWSGQSVSMLGSAVSGIALPLVALGVLRATTFEMGVLAAIQYVPYLAFGLFVGVWVDRLQRRPLLIAADWLRALLLLAIPVASLTGVLRMELLYALALAFGIASLFFEFAYQAYLPALIPAALLVEGNSKLAQSASVAHIVGPGIGGVLVQLLTAPLAVVVDAASYVVSAIALASIRRPEVRPASPTRRHIAREIVEGLAFVFRHPIIRALAVNSGLSNFFGSMVVAVYFVYLARELALEPSVIGVVLAAGGPGALLGAASSGRAAAVIGIGPALVLGQLLLVANTALIVLSLGFPQAAVPLLAAASFLVGVGATYYNVTLYAMRQAITPEPLRGRTVASVRLVTVGVMPFGALVGGFLGERVGVGPTIQIALAGAVLAVAPLLLSEVPRLRSAPES